MFDLRSCCSTTISRCLFLRASPQNARHARPWVDCTKILSVLYSSESKEVGTMVDTPDYFTKKWTKSTLFHAHYLNFVPKSMIPEISEIKCCPDWYWYAAFNVLFEALLCHDLAHAFIKDNQWIFSNVHLVYDELRKWLEARMIT